MLAYQHGYLDDYVPDDAIDPEPFIQAELADATDGPDLSRRIDKALDEKLYDDAVMYAEIADYMQVELNASTPRPPCRRGRPARRAARGAAEASKASSPVTAATPQASWAPSPPILRWSATCATSARRARSSRAARIIRG